MNAAASPAAVVVRRTIAAPPELLFDAWLDPIALADWMRPGTIRRTTARVDARVGGRYEIVMEGDETYPHHGVYQVIDRPRRLVFTWNSRNTDSRDTLVTVDFNPVDSRTEIIVTHERLPEGERPSHANGWTSGIERLAQRCEARP